MSIEEVKTLWVDECSQYLQLYVENGHWWLDYLSSTDEKHKTYIILKNILEKLPLFNNPDLEMLDIGPGEGSVIIPVLNYINSKSFFSNNIDLVEPSPYLYNILKTNINSDRLINKQSINIHNCSFQSFSPAKKYDLIFAMNSLNGFISKTNIIHFNRILNLLDKDGICVFILQSKKGRYKEIQQMLNEYKYKTEMLNAESFMDILVDNNCYFENIYFESKLHIDLSMEGIKKNKGLYSLWFRENIDHIKEKKLLSIISSVKKQLGIQVGDITIGNYVLILKKIWKNG